MIAEKLRLLLEFMPILSAGMTVVNAEPGKPRVLAALSVLDMLADKSPTKIDDELIQHLTAVFQTPAGSDLIDWVAEKIRPLMETEGEA